MMIREMDDDTDKDPIRLSVSERKVADRRRLLTTEVNTAETASSGSTLVSTDVRQRIDIDIGAGIIRPAFGSGRLESPMEGPRRTAASVFGNTFGRFATLGLAELRMVLPTCMATPAVTDCAANESDSEDQEPSESSKKGMKEPKIPGVRAPSGSARDSADKSTSTISLSLPNGTCHSFTRPISVASVLTQFSASFPSHSVTIASGRSPSHINPRPLQEALPLPLTHMLSPANIYLLQPMRIDRNFRVQARNDTCTLATQGSEVEGNSEGQMAEMITECTSSLPPLSNARCGTEEVMNSTGNAVEKADLSLLADVIIGASSSDRVGTSPDNRGDDFRNRGRSGGCFGSGSFEAVDENGNAESGDSENSLDKNCRGVRAGAGLGRLSRSFSGSFLPGEGGGSWVGGCGGGGSGQLVGTERARRNQVADISQIGAGAGAEAGDGAGERKVGGELRRAWTTKLGSKWEPRLGPIRESGSWGASMKMSPQKMLMRVERAGGNAKMRLMRSRLKSKEKSGSGRGGMEEAMK